MKNIYIVILCCLLMPLLLSAQNTMAEKGRQLVYFKDGSIVKGVILEYKLDERLIMLVGGEEVELPVKRVDYITRGRQSRKYEKQLKEEERGYEYAFSERGLYNVSSFSVNIGQNQEGTVAGISLQHVTGYQLNRWIGLGLGVSLDAYTFAQEKPFLSVFGDARGYLTKTKVAPFYALQAGYGVLNDKRNRETRGGLMVYPAVGLRLSGRAGSNVSMDIGYKYQDSYREFGWDDSYTIWDYRYHRYVFRVSVNF